ncbi:MAG: oligosaccharide flippase family protein, partial [Vicinamibacteria bacterium]
MARNTIAIFAGDGVQRAMDLVFLLVMARLAGPADYGLLMLATASTGFITDFISVHIEESVVRFAAEAIERGEAARTQTILAVGYVTNGIIILATVAILLAAAPLIAGRYRVQNPEEVASLIRILSLVPLAKIFNGTSKMALRIFDRFTFLASYRAVKGILNLALPLALYFAWGRDLRGAAWGFVASAVATTMIVQAGTWRELRRRFAALQMSPFRPELRRLFPFVFHTNLSGYLKSINRYFDVLLLGVFAPPAVVGYYKLALSVTSSLGIIAQPLSYVIYPTFSRLSAAGKNVELRALIAKSSLVLAALTIPAALLLASLSSPILARFANGEDFAPAAGALPILLLYVTASNVLIWTRPATLAIGKPEYSTVANTLSTLLLLALCFILFPTTLEENRHVAAAVAVTASQVTGMLLIVFLLY